MNANNVRSALIYTNAQCEVAYANLHFFQMMQLERTQELIGEPLAGVLGIRSETVQQFKQQAMTHNDALLLLEMRDPTGTIGYLLVLGASSTDERGDFIGLNITFEQVKNTAQTEGRSDLLLDVADRLVAAAPGEEAPTPAPVPLAEVRYAIAQVEGMQTFLARVMGIGVRNRMESLINDLAQRRSWPISMRHGQLEMVGSSPTHEWSGELLKEALDYAVGVAGRTWVQREMARIEARLDPEIVERADALGFRDYLIAK